MAWTGGLVGALLSGGGLGAAASIQAASFYAGLQRPGWAPPGWLFGPVWTVLYGMMAVSVWLIWRRGGWGGARGALTVFVLQLGLNGLWSWLFFAWHMGAWAFADIVALWLALVATIVTFARHSRSAAWLLVLNYAVWQLNPQLLG